MHYDPSLILTDDNRAGVVAFLLEAGHPAPSLAVASNIQLVNLYHMTGRTHSGPSIEEACARAVLVTMETMAQAARTPLPPPPPHAHYRFPLVLHAASLGDHLMLVGPAGCGKTRIIQQVADVLAFQFYITSTINDPHELLGFKDGYGNYNSTPFRRAFETGGMWCADEVDAWDAPALLAANAALANGICQFPDCEIPTRRHDNFRMGATANTFGTGADRIYVGRNELDAASLDRFAVIEIDYDLDLEVMLAGGTTRWLEHVWNVRDKVQANRIRHVVSTRAIINGTRALSDGMAWDDVNELYLFKGMSANDRRKIDD